MDYNKTYKITENAEFNNFIAEAPKDRPFQAWVGCDPYGKEGRQKIWFYIEKHTLGHGFDFESENLRAIIFYPPRDRWLKPEIYYTAHYKGTFQFVNPSEL